MRDIFGIARRCIKILDSKEHKKLLMLLVAVAMMSSLELLGVVSILPFMSVATNPSLIQSNEVLRYTYTFFSFETEQSFLFFLGALALCFLVVGNMVRAFSSYLLLKFSNMQNYYLGRRILANYLHQPYEFFLSYNSSELSRTVLSEVSQVIGGVLTPMLRAFGRLFTVLLIVLMIFYVNPSVAMVMALVLGASYFTVYSIFKRRITTLGKDRNQNSALRFKLINEVSGGIKEVKLMNREQVYLADFDTPSISYAKALVHNSVLGEIPRYFLEIIAFGGMLIIVMYLISTEGQSKAISLTALYALAGYKLMPALQEIFSAVTKIKFSLPVLTLVEKSLEKNGINVESSVKESEKLIFEKIIQLKGLSFKYKSSHKPILDLVDLDINHNSTVGIVGSTGSGKTTLVDIVLGLLQPEQGGVFIDGVCLSSANLASWQRQIGYVPQFIYLSDNSIEANIAFGVPSADIDQELLIKAAKLAQIDEFINNELPEGYKTVIGERGVRLSGGQRQRIGVARALYNEPSLLVFDEATSALDAETEKAIIDSIEALSGKKTIIMIAHRISTLKKADQIVRVQDGKVLIELNSDKIKSAEGIENVKW